MNFHCDEINKKILHDQLSIFSMIPSQIILRLIIMNFGKTLFSQVMEYVPWKTFERIITRYKGNAGVRTLDCADIFRVMAFSQLTRRESLRDIEACLNAHHQKLFHMGLRNVPARSTFHYSAG